MFFDNPVNGEKDQSYPDQKICFFMVYLMTLLINQCLVDQMTG
jgi:hypothetical protein